MQSMTLIYGIHSSVFVFIEIASNDLLFLILAICCTLLCNILACGFAVILTKLGSVESSMLRIQKLNLNKYKRMFNTI